MCSPRWARLKWPGFVLLGILLQGCIAPNGTLDFETLPSGGPSGEPFAQPGLSWSGSSTLYLGTCSAYVLSVGFQGTSSPILISSVSVSLSDSGSGSFYGDSGCTSSVSSVVVAAGTNSATIYLKAAQTGTTILQASATGYQGASYSLTVVNQAPVITSASNFVFPSNAVTVGSAMTPQTFVNQNTGNNVGMTYTCSYNQNLSGIFSSPCSSLSGVSFTAGVFNWTPTSAEWGAYQFEVIGANSAGSSTQTFIVDLFQGYPTTGLMVDYDADFANLDGPAVVSDPMQTTWRNIYTTGSGFDGLLNAFPTAGTSSNGWTGGGSTSSPYALAFGGSEYVNVATDLASSPAMLTAWVSPLGIAGTASGAVIATTNDNGTGAGMTIRQSAQFPGTYEIETVGSYEYTQEILSVGASDLFGYWRLNDAGTTLADSSGNDNSGSYYLGSSIHTPTREINSPVTGDLSAASEIIPYASAGPTYGTASTVSIQTGPQTFSEEIWFKASAGYTQGGYLMGFGSQSVNASTTSDRKIWMDSTGKVNAGVNSDGSNVVLSSNKTYNDGFWHQAVATFSADSFSLYLDGTAANSTTAIGTADAYSGYWRIGYDSMAGWTPAPSSPEFQGQLAEASAYSIVLSAAQVQQHYQLATRRCQSAVVTGNGGWTFLAGTYDGQTSVLYVNGSPACSITYPQSGEITSGAVEVTLGGTQSTGPDWTGELADFKAYSSGSSSMVQAIYDATSPRF